MSDEIRIKKMLAEIAAYVGDPTKGLPEEVFLFVSSLTPLVNVDLLIRDPQKGILLAWRNDPYHGMGWHVPGGIIRMKETLDTRIQKTAELELGTRVSHSEKPLEIVPLIEKHLEVRSHFFTFVYDCRLPQDYTINNNGRKEHDMGYLRWYRSFPKDMIGCHEFYRKYF